MTRTDPGYRAMSLGEEVVLTAGWKPAAPPPHETELFRRRAGAETGAGWQRERSVRRRLAAAASGYRRHREGCADADLLVQGRPVLRRRARDSARAWDCRADHRHVGDAAGRRLLFRCVRRRRRAANAATLDFVYQPLVWSWRRFPAKSYLTPEAMATTAATFVTAGGLTEGVAADPAEIPYRFATFQNSRFGLTLRDVGRAGATDAVCAGARRRRVAARGGRAVRVQDAVRARGRRLVRRCSARPARRLRLSRRAAERGDLAERHARQHDRVCDGRRLLGLGA